MLTLKQAKLALGFSFCVGVPSFVHEHEYLDDDKKTHAAHVDDMPPRLVPASRVCIYAATSLICAIYLKTHFICGREPGLPLPHSIRRGFALARGDTGGAVDAFGAVAVELHAGVVL